MKKRKLKLPKSKKQNKLDEGPYVPHPYYWDKELRTGIDLITLPELEFTVSPEWRKERNEQLRNSKWEFTKTEKDTISKQNKIISKQIYWEANELELSHKCKVLGIEYKEPEPIPNKLKHTWLNDDQKRKDAKYVDKWNHWLFNDDYRIYTLKDKILKEERNRIKELRKQRWLELTEEQRLQIIDNEKKQKEEEERKRSRSIYVEPSSGSISEPNGMTIIINPNDTPQQIAKKKAELKEAYRESLR